jgi:IS1 family transposase
MNKLPREKQVQVLSALVEGASINSVVRMTGVAKTTVLRLLRDVGTVCTRFHDHAVRGVKAETVQCDEIWSFCYAKDKNVPAEMRGRSDVGSVWTWTGIDAKSKLIVSWHLGGRTLPDARLFIGDLARRLHPLSHPHIVTDGLSSYLSAIVEEFPGGTVDYSILMKVYGPSGNDRQPETRYSPGRLVGLEKQQILGNASAQEISTSFVERANLTIRMGNRRFTRLTNGHSKKFENHAHMLALGFTYYNFCRKHLTLKTTPAIAAGIVDAVWTLSDLIALTEMPPMKMSA